MFAAVLGVLAVGVAERDRRRLVCERAQTQAIPDSLGAKVGLLHHGPVGGEKRRIFLLHVGEGGERLGLILLRSHLNHILARLCRGWRHYGSGHFRLWRNGGDRDRVGGGRRGGRRSGFSNRSPGRTTIVYTARLPAASSAFSVYR